MLIPVSVPRSWSSQQLHIPGKPAPSALGSRLCGRKAENQRIQQHSTHPASPRVARTRQGPFCPGLGPSSGTGRTTPHPVLSLSCHSELAQGEAWSLAKDRALGTSARGPGLIGEGQGVQERPVWVWGVGQQAWRKLLKRQNGSPLQRNDSPSVH